MKETLEARMGRLMRDVRESRGVTQERLAKKLGRDQATISQWENARSGILAADFLAWADVLALTKDEWLAFRKLDVDIAA